MAHLLELDGVQTEIRLRRSTVHALDGVSLTVDPGECLGIVGESGCGKTMTALSVMRLLPPGGHIIGGKILLDGKEISALSDNDMRHVRGNEIGMIFQDPMTSLNPTMRIGDQISETVLLHRGASAAEARERAIEVLGLVGMPRPAERVGNYPHQLSGGMRQRVMIAMALACEPKLLIADEPTTALDVTIQKQILELIDSLRKRLSMAVILVTHDLGVIAGRADRTVVMYAPRRCSRRSRRRVPSRRGGCTTSRGCRRTLPSPRQAAGSRRGAGTRRRGAARRSRNSRGTAGSTCSAASSRWARRSGRSGTPNWPWPRRKPPRPPWSPALPAMVSCSGWITWSRTSR